MTQRVLIIDDEENIRRMMRLTLESAGYGVGEASSGQQGLDVYAREAPWDVVLLDQRMPGMDGLETLRRLKQRDRNSRVIMITAYASIELAVNAMKVGASDFVRKPMTPDILRGAVAAAISKSARRATEPVAEVEKPQEPPEIETITLNGFEIIRPGDSDATSSQPNERIFTVLAPEGKRSRVTVKIDDEVIGYVERIARRRLEPGNSFWTNAAEQLLSDYLWNEGATPSSGKLTLKSIDREQLLQAERWEK